MSNSVPRICKVALRICSDTSRVMFIKSSAASDESELLLYRLRFDMLGTFLIVRFESLDLLGYC